MARRSSGRLIAIGVLSAAWVLALACSSGKSDRTVDGAGGTTSGTGGTGAIDLGTDGGLSVDGSIGDGSVEPPLETCDETTPCAEGNVCVRQESGGGLCSPIGDPCTEDSDCQNDTYCCSGDCRLDGVTDGVCVVGTTRPTNKECTTAIAVGVFAPDLQCEWKEPPEGDPYPNHKQVLTTPLVANLPNDSGTAAEIIVVTSASNSPDDGRIRILNGQTCEQVGVIEAGPAVHAPSTPAIGDLDGDGDLEIVSRVTATSGNDKIIAFEWDGSNYVEKWTSDGGVVANLKNSYDGVSLHDLNNDGKPEVIGRGGEVLNGESGDLIAGANAAVFLGSDPVIVDVDADGTMDLVANKVFSWTGSGWSEKYPASGISAAFFGAADFGTRSGPGNFDHTALDGRAEIVTVGMVGGDESTGVVAIHTLEGDELMRVDFPNHDSCSVPSQAFGERGGPPTIGDFDGDGMPELASAGAYAYRVFDLDCNDAGQSCEDASKWIRWSSEVQDCTSGATGSTIFDFEGDGRAEAVYADECFVRVYDGLSGEVLFSTPRASPTWWEQPVVADPDNSDRSKIIFGGSSLYYSHATCGSATAEPRSPAVADARKNRKVDKHYRGVRCQDNDDCISQNCVEGFCRCTTDLECGNDWDAPISDGNDVMSGMVCTSPIEGTPGTGNVCRAMNAEANTSLIADKYYTGVKVFRDKLDRWASSRPLWNQHAYSITNINDDGTIPSSSEWQQNFLQPGLNNFRQNRQGSTSADLADMTGALDASEVCKVRNGGGITFGANVCNRGLRGVGANMPATFYLGEVADGEIVCQTETNGPVPVGDCLPIECTIEGGDVPPPGSVITMVVNDAGSGARITDECNYDNNTSSVKITRCAIPK